MAVLPQLTDLSRPRTRLEDYAVVGDDEAVSEAPLAKLHLMSDENGDFPLSSLNGWEQQVVQVELARDGAAGWYRNPPRQAVDALGIAYRSLQGNWRSMHPDFVFFHKAGGKVRASIVDPHGHHLDDALQKLQALARFAEEHGQSFHRIEALSQVGNQMKALDLQRPDVRTAVTDESVSAERLYLSGLADDYRVG